MTEIPQHLRDRAKKARETAETPPAGLGYAMLSNAAREWWKATNPAVVIYELGAEDREPLAVFEFQDLTNSSAPSYIMNTLYERHERDRFTSKEIDVDAIAAQLGTDAQSVEDALKPLALRNDGQQQ